MQAVYTLAYVVYDQLHILTGMYNLYTEKAMNNVWGFYADCGWNLA